MSLLLTCKSDSAIWANVPKTETKKQGKINNLMNKIIIYRESHYKSAGNSKTKFE